jgi:proteic killer suppression protein
MAIQSFGDLRTAKVFRGVTDKEVNKLKPILSVARRKLDMIDFAARPEDLKVPPGNHWEALQGKLRGFYSIRINDQWRIIFRWEQDGPRDVEITHHYK